MQIDEESAKSGITLTIDFRQLMRENEVLANSIQLQYHKVISLRGEGCAGVR